MTVAFGRLMHTSLSLCSSLCTSCELTSNDLEEKVVGSG